MKRKNKNNTLLQNETTASHEQPKIDIVDTNKNNRTLISRFSNCGKTYLMKYILLQKRTNFSI